MNRIDRLAAILIHLQTKRIVKAEEIADRFEISLRTVYRDVKALMEAGVPIGSEAGTGYFIVDGYHLPPVMLTQEEANAMLLAGKLVEKMTDHSVLRAFESALMKIKSVLNDRQKDHLEELQGSVMVQFSNRDQKQPDFPDRFLTELQQAVVQKQIVEIDYYASYNDQFTTRMLEPIGLFYYGASWHLIAWCQLRNDYRDFRADRIKELRQTGKPFQNRNLLSLQEYLKTVTMEHREMEKVIVLFDKSVVRYLGQQKYHFGYVGEEIVDDKVRMTFLTGYIRSLARWLLVYGNMVQVESPDHLNEILVELVKELESHYMSVSAQ
ncbi:MAG TPA: YafY family protein [Cyclobacteriaceae bacterium]|nr:YafY family protein [Cyclobacteriaceae bacterium]